MASINQKFNEIEKGQQRAYLATVRNRNGEACQASRWRHLDYVYRKRGTGKARQHVITTDRAATVEKDNATYPDPVYVVHHKRSDGGDKRIEKRTTLDRRLKTNFFPQWRMAKVLSHPWRHIWWDLRRLIIGPIVEQEPQRVNRSVTSGLESETTTLKVQQG